MWVLLALMAAVCQASGDMFNKSRLKEIGDYELCIGLYALSAAILIPITLGYHGAISVQSNFWLPYISVIILDTLGMICYLKALRTSDLSLTLPFQMFTPLFLLATSPIMLGEYPSAMGLVGVVLIVIGSYFVNSKSFEQDLLAPFKALIKEPGPRYMCIGAFIWSLTCNLHKSCSLASDPITYATMHRVGLLIVVILIGRYLYSDRSVKSVDHPGASNTVCMKDVLSCWPAALFCSATIVFHNSALSIGLVVYATAIKRTSVLFGICLAAVFLKELGIRQRFAGASIMTAGVFCMAL
jgi:drug/metabolite transporter (DMT)-like permease